MSDEPQPQQPNEGVAPEKPLPAEGPGKPGGHEEKATDHHTDRPRRPGGAREADGTGNTARAVGTGRRGAEDVGGAEGGEGAPRRPNTPNHATDGTGRSGASRSDTGRPGAGGSE
ncbi:hypothetical protein, partial [Streptomyces sp. NPDC049590]|uniref:hypothetical protein n=1 Tax=Streptomyces sp. NPDC049590 TaxID=3154834 RepID=UPI00342B51B9